ncbi:Copia protein, partial [Mucuna pruriens]
MLKGRKKLSNIEGSGPPRDDRKSRILSHDTRHFIKEKLNSGLVVITHVPTRLQVVDVFTKGLPAARFQEHNNKLGMIDIHLPT